MPSPPAMAPQVKFNFRTEKTHKMAKCSWLDKMKFIVHKKVCCGSTSFIIFQSQQLELSRWAKLGLPTPPSRHAMSITWRVVATSTAAIRANLTGKPLDQIGVLLISLLYIYVYNFILSYIYILCKVTWSDLDLANWIDLLRCVWRNLPWHHGICLLNFNLWEILPVVVL